MLDHIERVVRFAGDLDADQRAKLLEIAKQVPGDSTLRSEVASTP